MTMSVMWIEIEFQGKIEGELSPDATQLESCKSSSSTETILFFHSFALFHINLNRENLGPKILSGGQNKKCIILLEIVFQVGFMGHTHATHLELDR